MPFFDQKLKGQPESNPMFEKPKRQFSAIRGILLTRQVACVCRTLVLDLLGWHSLCYRALLRIASLCFVQLVYVDFDCHHFLASQKRQTMSASSSLVIDPLIVVPFSWFASRVALLFSIQYSPSTQNEPGVVQNRALNPIALSCWLVSNSTKRRGALGTKPMHVNSPPQSGHFGVGFSSNGLAVMVKT